MDTEPSNSRWMVPAGFFFIFMLAGYYIAQDAAGDWKCLAALALGLAFICGISAIRNHQAYFQRVQAETFAIQRDALTETSETLLFKYARSMHPEAVRLLLLHRKKLWMIKRGKGELADTVDWILEEAPIVHVEFCRFFLENSSQSLCMAQRMLAEGSKKFDPEGLVTDREQYAAFLSVLQRSLMATQPWGNQPAQWIPAWDPKSVARAFGIQEEEKEEKETA